MLATINAAETKNTQTQNRTTSLVATLRFKQRIRINNGIAKTANARTITSSSPPELSRLLQRNGPSDDIVAKPDEKAP